MFLLQNRSITRPVVGLIQHYTYFLPLSLLHSHTIIIFTHPHSAASDEVASQSVWQHQRACSLEYGGARLLDHMVISQVGPQTPVECVPTPKGTHDSMSGLTACGPTISGRSCCRATRCQAAHAVEPHAGEAERWDPEPTPSDGFWLDCVRGSTA